MRLLTTSSSKCFRSCQRKYQFRYVDGVRPAGDAHALHFGTLWHGMQEEWWSHSLCHALDWLEAQPDVDAFDLVKLRELMIGYDLRWGGEPLAVHTVEQEFRLPLLNPATDAASRTYQRAGKLDLVADHTGTGERWLIEHKTSSEDISAGSPYWQKLRMDTQVSNYYVGARSLGHDIVGCIYDVVGKPTIKPAKATPEEKRKYKKCGALYANMREFDETPEEYAARLREHIANNPERYYQRGEVPRLESDEVEAARDTWATAQAMREAERLRSFPRNPDACFTWGRACEYWDVCTGSASVDDAARFRRERPHEELEMNENSNTNDGERHGSDGTNGSANYTNGAQLDF